MSGVEIIGLLLGALPLAISAVEHYRVGFDTLKEYSQYENTLKSLRTRLWIQQELFEGTLQCLLREDISESQAKALFPDASLKFDRSLWGSAEIKAKLQRKLDNKYRNFMDVIEEMEMVMRQLMKKLDVDIEEKPKWDKKLSASLLPGIKGWKREWRKIRRCFGRKEREDLIQKFERYNTNISEFVKQQEILAPTSKARPFKFLECHRIVQDNVCGLYDALEAGWKCRCLSSHKASLRLECWKTAHPSPVFKVFLSSLNRPGQDETPQKTWFEAQVHIDGLDKRPRITSLCEALKAAQNQSPTLGFLPDTSRNRCINIKMTNSIPSDFAERISLSSLLPSSNMAFQHHRPHRTLTCKQRLRIAVTLAHAVLHLHESPWLSEAWSKSDIYFFSHGVDRYQHPIIDHPYVSRSFEQQAQLQVDSSSITHVADLPNSFILNKSLFALGILFIELSLNRPFEDLCLEARDPNALAPEGPLRVMETYSVATSLIKAVCDELGEAYGYVVQRCLRCEFGIQDSKKQLGFDAFRALVHEGVLEPLENVLKGFP